MQQRIYKVGTIKKDRVYILTLFLTNFFHYLVYIVFFACQCIDFGMQELLKKQSS